MGMAGKDDPADKPVSFTEILAIWKLENDNPDTFKKFTRMMAKLVAFVGHDDAKRITPQQIVGFETSLRQAGKLHPNTVSNYMGALNAVFKVAKRKFMIEVNPMADVKVPAKIDTDVIPYTPEQVRTIVTEAQKLRIELFLCAVVQAYTGISLLRADSRQHVRRILWPEWRRSATMGVLKSVEPTGFLAFAPAFAGTNWADVNRRIIQNCPHGRGRVLSSPACLVPALPA